MDDCLPENSSDNPKPVDERDDLICCLGFSKANVFDALASWHVACGNVERNMECAMCDVRPLRLLGEHSLVQAVRMMRQCLRQVLPVRSPQPQSILLRSYRHLLRGQYRSVVMVNDQYVVIRRFVANRAANRLPTPTSPFQRAPHLLRHSYAKIGDNKCQGPPAPKSQVLR